MRLIKLVPDNTNIRFVAVRKIAFTVTLILSILAVGLVFVRGLNFGVDFMGGVAIEEKFATPPAIDKVRASIERLGVGEPAIQQFGDPTIVSIRLPVPEGDSGATDRLVERVKATLAAEFPGATFSNYSTVSGKVSDELVTNGILAVVLAIVLVVGVRPAARRLTRAVAAWRTDTAARLERLRALRAARPSRPGNGHGRHRLAARP